MENILVIGNGFDIAHGFNTRYDDFINFCQTIADVYNSFDETQWSQQSNFLDQLKHQLDKLFEEKSVSRKAITYFSKLQKNAENYQVIEICKDNYWLKYVQQNKKNMNEKWSDFEYIIAEQIEILAYIANHYNWSSDIKEMMNTKYATKLTSLFTQLTEYKQKNNDFQVQIDIFKKYLMQELNHLTWLLEIYLTRFLNTKMKTIELFQILPITKLISFNYTDTYSKMYNKTIDMHYIHGMAVKERPYELNNMVFGIGKDIHNTTSDDEYNYVEFQKYYQRIIKKTGNTYTKWLNDSEQFFVYFFGHSLDIVDGDIIKNFIYCQNSKVIIFYYNQSALNIMVVNLAKILGKDDLIDFTNSDKISFYKTDNINDIKKFISDYHHNENIQKKSHKKPSNSFSL